MAKGKRAKKADGIATATAAEQTTHATAPPASNGKPARGEKGEFFKRVSAANPGLVGKGLTEKLNEEAKAAGLPFTFTTAQVSVMRANQNKRAGKRKGKRGRKAGNVARAARPAMQTAATSAPANGHSPIEGLKLLIKTLGPADVHTLVDSLK